ncbi:MAG TPA: DUF4932 domain-containing protein [Saprospiraceae bacterium]|nr:DUF4932 domain-containing protein [Saprospiraceae bacterium]
MKLHVLILFFTLSFQGSVTLLNAQEHIVKFNETYELANIILALTDYGKADKNEINKNSPYYQEVLAYFDKYSNHPVVQKVNYSRKLWDKLLSFRTDAVAFEFTKEDKLYRKYKFYSMGKKINEFELNLELIEDFAKKSEFRRFYNEKSEYFDNLQFMYEKSLYIKEVESFLSKEFKINIKAKHQIIVSPLVGRMHCQRPFNNLSTSFINIPDYIFSAKNLNDIDEDKIASGLHMFFTEIDHDYINPTSIKFKKEIKKKFNPKNWDKGSGYEKSKNGTFNEYMTWAVYDIFIKRYFPKVSDKAISEWHKVNAGRGFYASQIFGQKLAILYVQKNENETLVDLYPKLLNWCGEVSDNLEVLTKNQ